MKKVKLFGDLQQFKAEWELDVKTPGEALRAINANRPGFLRAADAGDYVAILFDENNPDMTRQVTMDNNSAPWCSEILIVVPRVGGEVAAATVAAWVGYSAAAYAAASTATVVAFTIAAAIINIGISLAVSALANIITGKKDYMNPGDTENYDSKPSFVSNGAVNVTRAGHPYPVIAGEFLCGSIVLSSQVHVKDILV
jgi:predicted phage tail protein